MTEQLTFSAAQQAAWRNKKTKGFGTTDVATEFCLLYGEVGEAFDAWRENRAPRPGRIRRILARLRLRPLPPPLTGQRSVRLELADAMIFLLNIAQMTGVDAGAAVAEKLRINQARSYRRLPGGAHTQTQGH